MTADGLLRLLVWVWFFSFDGRCSSVIPVYQPIGSYRLGRFLVPPRTEPCVSEDLPAVA